MEEKLTKIQAYRAMFYFVKRYYQQKGKPQELWSLLLATETLGDFFKDPRKKGEGTILYSGNPTSWKDWLKGVELLLGPDNMEAGLTNIQAYKAMVYFIKQYSERKLSPETLQQLLTDVQILDELEHNPQSEGDENMLVTGDPSSWDHWLDAVNFVLNQSQSDIVGKRKSEHSSWRSDSIMFERMIKALDDTLTSIGYPSETEKE